MRVIIVTLFITIVLKLTSGAIVNQTVLFQKYGYNKDSNLINLRELSIETIDVNTFQGLNNLQIIYLGKNILINISIF